MKTLRLLIAPVLLATVITGIGNSASATSYPKQSISIPKDKKKRCPQYEHLLKKYDLKPVETFSYIMWRESRCNPKSQNASWDKNGKMTSHLNANGSYDTGLLQINSSWKTVTRNVCGKNATDNHMAGLKDVDCNLRVASWLLYNTKSGIRNWGGSSGL